jgi:hypothetical protein
LNGVPSGTSTRVDVTVGAAPTAIAPVGTIVDADSSNFWAGSLRVSFTQNGTSTDQLDIITDSMVTLTGFRDNVVRVNGVAIGTVSGGNDGADLVIRLNFAATPERVQLLLEHIGYSNSSDSPSTLDREVTFTLNDGDGRLVGGDTTGTAMAVVHYGGPVNLPATAVGFTDTTTSINENADTAARIKVADIVVTDDGLGSNALSLSGADAGSFEIDGTTLYLKAGVVLDHEAKASYSVSVDVNDPTVGGDPDVSQVFTLNVGDVNEAPTTIGFTDTTTSINENTDTAARIKVADIVVTDDGLGSNALSLSDRLWLK